MLRQSHPFGHCTGSLASATIHTAEHAGYRPPPTMRASRSGSHGSPRTEWQVGMATAPALQGPWTRMPWLNPATYIETPMGVENPIVTRTSNRSIPRTYIAVYDALMPDQIHPAGDKDYVGVTQSADGVHWSPAQYVSLNASKSGCGATVRTPQGLVAEPGLCTGCYSMLCAFFYSCVCMCACRGVMSVCTGQHPHPSSSDLDSGVRVVQTQARLLPTLIVACGWSNATYLPCLQPITSNGCEHSYASFRL
jgi:hypothetical protein